MENVTKILRGRPRRLTDREVMDIATDSGGKQSIICPCCGSGSGEHGTGLFRNSDENKQHMVHCASCKKTFTYDVQYLNRIYGGRKGTPLEIHENINYYKTFKYLKEVRGIDEYILTRFLFSDGDEYRCFIYGYDDNSIKHKQELVYDVSTNELHKYFSKNDTNFFYTELIVDEKSDIFFVVESVTNALSIASLGFNSVVIYTATNIDKFALSYILTKKKLKKTILCLDYDKIAVMEKYETLNYRIFDFSRFEEFLSNPKLDINDLFLQCKEKLLNYLNELKNAKIEKETNTELACEEIENLIDKSKNNCVIIPTGAGKTHYITKQLKEDKNAISFHPTIENVDEMAEQGVNTITHDGEKYESSEVGKSMCYARPKLELDNETYEVKTYIGGTEEEIRDKNAYCDEVDKSLEKISIPIIRIFRLKEKKFINQSDKKRVYMPTIHHDNSKILSDIQEKGYIYYIDFFFDKNRDCDYSGLKKKILIGDREFTLTELIDPKLYIKDRNPKCNEYYLPLPALKLYKKISSNDSFDTLVRDRHSYFLNNSNYFTDLEAFINWTLEFLYNAEIHATFPEVYDENGNTRPVGFEEFQVLSKNPATKWANIKNHSEWFSIKICGISTQVLQRILFNAKTCQMFTASENVILTELLTELGRHYNFSIKRSRTNYLINILFNIYYCPKAIGVKELKKWAEQLEQRVEKMVVVCKNKETAKKRAIECSKFINTACTKESNLIAFDCENSNGLITFSYPDSPFMRGSNKFRDVKYCLIDSEIFFPINSVGWYNHPSDEMAVQNGLNLLLQVLGRLCRVGKDGIKMIKKVGLYNFNTTDVYNILMAQSIAKELQKLKIEYEFKNVHTKEELLISFFSNSLELVLPHVESYDPFNQQIKKTEEIQDVPQNETKKERFFEKYYDVPDNELIFFDTEVYKNLFILVTKRHADKNCKIYVNPTLKALEEVMHPFCKYWVGYNCNMYDNCILYQLKKLLKGNQNYSVIMPELKKVSDDIVTTNSPCRTYGKIQTYLDFYKLCSKDKSLSKLKYELGYPCLETPYSFDVDIQPDQIEECVNYCVNDVLGLEYAFFQPQYYQKYLAHKNLCKMVDIQVSNSTNTTTGVLIFGHTSNLWRKSQLKLPNLTEYIRNIPGYKNAKFEVQESETGANGVFVNGDTKIVINRGGENKTVAGKHTNVVSLDVDSMYVTTFINTRYFGDFTERIKQLRDVRLALKRKDLAEVHKLYKEFGEFISNEHIDFKLASDMLKLCLNSLYGLSSASFDNFMKLPENETNLIANLGNIMMNELYRICTEEKYWKVVHIKTDGIKIADCTEEMIKFCIDFAKSWGYNFSIDEKYKEFLIIDKSNYIGLTEDGKISSRGELFNNNWLKSYIKDEFDRETASIILQVRKGVIVNHSKNNTKVGKCIRVFPSVNGDEYYKIMPEKEIFECVADTKKPGRNKDRDVFKFNVYTDFNQNDFDKSYFDNLYNKILLKIGSSKVLNKTKKEADDILRSFFTETA